MTRAIFPGTFDPFTIGHSSVVNRALTFIDEIVIGIGINENKNTYFPLEKREKMIRDFYRNEPRVTVQTYNSLTSTLTSTTPLPTCSRRASTTTSATRSV